MNVLPPLNPADERPSTPDNGDYLARLVTYFEDYRTYICKWPREFPTPEEMAGAGFTYNPTGTWADNVHCDSCKMDAFSWVAKDDPFKQHSDCEPRCAYVKSQSFADFHAKFLAKKSNNRGRTRNTMAAPAADAAAGAATGAAATEEAAAPRTGRGRGRRKIALSEIQVVADLEPIAVVMPTPSPMRIQISGAGVNMNLTVNETPTKKRRLN
ncbi:hypothetical protein B0T11DRAFT_329353 [Plectosphaerella cucumerina]|uniref:Uncharacterized protein n=1 Tax=Plectosphaerella cucumerina TaxID=40658 RepID=A0A8K0X5E0_9PEZI|nr:hypothetical protein B0T11DRAFT_329353 [Plectosphaerella cucumerina]